MTLGPVTDREQALGKWIDALAEASSDGNDRLKVILLCHAQMVLAADDDANPIVPEPERLRSFVERVARGCKARGGKRGEAAVGAGYAALASVIVATRGA